MQPHIDHGSGLRKPLVAIAEVEWEGATRGVGTIDLTIATATSEPVYACAGASYKACFRGKQPAKDIQTTEGYLKNVGRVAQVRAWQAASRLAYVLE